MLSRQYVDMLQLLPDRRDALAGARGGLMRTLPYLDYHATTPDDPRAVAAMMPYFSERFGNAASRTHAAGRDAQAAVRASCDRIARLIGASAEQVVFTIGATESNNLALQGTAFARRGRGMHVVTVATEHRSVLD